MSSKSRPIFLSYRHDTDTKIATRLQEELASRNIETWIDSSDIEPGAAWDATIEEAIESCSSVLLLLSANTLESQWVNREIKAAQRHNKKLIPVFLENYAPPKQAKPKYITSALEQNGVSLFDRSNLYVEKAINTIVQLIASEMSSDEDKKQAKINIQLELPQDETKRDQFLKALSGLLGVSSNEINVVAEKSDKK